MTGSDPSEGAPIGRWRISQMDESDLDELDLVEEAFIDLEPNGHGSFVFSVVEGDVDYRVEEQAGEHVVRFSWCGLNECDPASGRGWLRRVSEDQVEGRIYFHRGDDYAFAAHRK